MVHQASGQFDFVDSWLGNNPKLNQRIDSLVRLLDWRPFELKLAPIYSSPNGRPSHPVLMLFKCLLLQAWYNLSDYTLEEALDDRLSFRRFVGLSVSEKALDHSVFSRFRDQLIKRKIHEMLFHDLERQLENRGLIVKKGTLVDATVIEAAPKNSNQNTDGSARKLRVSPAPARTSPDGKKSLACSLLLAIFLQTPCPFCLLGYSA